MSWDLDRDGAVELARVYLAAMQPPRDDQWVVTHVDERAWGWVVSWVNQKVAQASTNVPSFYAGGGPFLIDRASGRVAMCGSAHPVDYYIDAWRNGQLADLPRP